MGGQCGQIFLLSALLCLMVWLGINLLVLLRGPSVGRAHLALHVAAEARFFCFREAWMLDSRPKGRGFEPHRCHCVVVLEQDTLS